MSHFFDATYPKARVFHQCDECYRYIEPGETYRRQTGILDTMFTSKLCAHCNVIWKLIWRIERPNPEDSYDADSYLESWDEHVWAIRLRACLRAKWRFQSGALMPVPDAPVVTS